MYKMTIMARYSTVAAMLAALVAGILLLPTMARGQTACQADGTDPLCIDDIGPASGLTDSNLQTVVGNLINAALSLLGIVAVVIVLIGGFKWMTAGGNDEKTAEARKLIFAGVIGLAIILSAYAIAKFVVNTLVTATSVSAPTTVTDVSG